MNYFQFIPIIGLFVALLGIYINTKSAARSRDTQIMLQILKEFSARYEGEWREVYFDVVSQLKSEEFSNLPKDLKWKCMDILNYVDMIGRVIKDGHLSNHNTILLSIYPRVFHLCEIMEPVLLQHRKQHGREIWGGLDHLKFLYKHR